MRARSNSPRAAAGQVSPGPLVGCVVVDESGEVVGEGFYVYEGVKHAETLALEQAGARARGATAYVTLEPHAHTGRTPPCTEALIHAGVTRVVASVEDPNPLVSGRGFAELREAGVEVVDRRAVAREAARLNEKYIHAHSRRTPLRTPQARLLARRAYRHEHGDARWISERGVARARAPDAPRVRRHPRRRGHRGR